ncbi:helix-turn-helix transcriptional regulator [bacterium]|jgi:DNA-binding XRE family transcriptional regulator|nr:helix-turn-helix transcriptional regulator [bacterium]
MSTETKPKSPAPVIKLIYDGYTLTYDKVPAEVMQSFLDAVGLERGYSYKPTLDADSLLAIGGEPSYRYGAYIAKKHRQDKGWTQSELALKLGLGQANVSNIEHARKPIGKRLAKKLGTAFNVDPASFLTDLEE